MKAIASSLHLAICLSLKESLRSPEHAGSCKTRRLCDWKRYGRLDQGAGQSLRGAGHAAESRPDLHGGSTPSPAESRHR